MQKFWKIAPYLSRIILLPPALIFAMIATRYLGHPVETGAAIGLAFNSALAVTIIRVGFGAFPLGCSLFTFSCLLSRRRVLTGLGFVATMMGAALVVRVLGMLADGTVKENMALVGAEVGLLTLTALGIWLEFASRRNGVNVAGLELAVGNREE